MIMKHNAINFISVREAAAAGMLCVGKEYGETSQARQEKRDEKHQRRVQNDLKLHQTRNDHKPERETRHAKVTRPPKSTMDQWLVIG
jgi:hypothetical protein